MNKAMILTDRLEIKKNKMGLFYEHKFILYKLEVKLYVR